MDSRLFPLSPDFFTKTIAPLITAHYKRPGRPPKEGHYVFFCAILYVLRTGISWRDLPSHFGHWHTVYTRFKRWSENGLFWSLVYQLQQKKALKLDFTWIDSTTIGLHRHGSGCLKKTAPNP
jgi:transposase